MPPFGKISVIAHKNEAKFQQIPSRYGRKKTHPGTTEKGRLSWVGMMGAGKTAWVALWPSKTLAVPFVDSDTKSKPLPILPIPVNLF